VTAVTDIPGLKPRPATSIWRQEADTEPDKLAFGFGMVLAIAVILAITTRAAPLNPKSESAVPIPPLGAIYRLQHWNLY
jgi:hypothetical protein